jgi:glycosyltransferase involved in cell wall biosynthesis
MPYQVSGAARSLHTLLSMLCEHGHECEAVAGLQRGWRRRLLHAMLFLTARRCLALSDRQNVYQTHRTLRRRIAALTARRLEAFRPDVVMTQLDRGREIAELALRRGLLVTLSVHDAVLNRAIWPRPHPRLKFITNSEFVASRVRDQLGLESTVIYPVIRLESYKVSSRVPEFITFVNPVPEKGVELALEIAALVPNHRFLFVESWPLGDTARRRLREGLKQLANVTFAGWTHDMRTVYSRTALLIVPSQWEEAFARVALEAQVSGIPVVARDIGGIGEVLRDSGILLPQNAAAEAWAQTIERLLSDQSFYAACSAAASINASRPEFNPFHQVDRFLAIATECISK